jgi:hypothetical protein
VRQNTSNKCAWNKFGVDPWINWHRMTSKSEQEKFWSRVSKSNGECWKWTGPTHPKMGHGMLRFGDKTCYAHRVAYALARGGIPVGLCVCHKCDTPSCCNPCHLFIATAAANNRDRHNKGRTKNLLERQAQRRNQTHCKRGHEYTLENTIRTTTQRMCRTCHTANSREFKRRKRQGKRNATLEK